jgi:hypothetical protein
MSTRSSQAGFSVVEIAIVAAVIVVIGALGYVFYNNYQKSQSKAESSQTADASEAPAITTANDLDTASKTIDNSDLESNSADDLSNMDKDLSAF